MLLEQETYLRNLEALVTARTEQLRMAASRFEEIAADLERLKGLLPSEAPILEVLIKKARSWSQ